jgi:hypothetical protein
MRLIFISKVITNYTINMSGKQVKAPTVYAFALYGGVMTKGYTWVSFTDKHPEVDVFDGFKLYYGNDLKGAYIKCQKPLDGLKEEVLKELEQYKYSDDNEHLHKRNITEVKKVFKQVSGAKSAHVLGDSGKSQEDEQEGEEQEEKVVQPKTKPAPKTTTKKVVEVEVEEEEAEEEEQQVQVKVKGKTVPAKTTTTATTTTAKATTAKTTTATATTSKATTAKTQEKVPVKAPTKVVVSKTTTGKGTKNQVVEDEDLEQELEVKTVKPKVQAKGTKTTQIVVSDSDDDEDENAEA